MPDYGGGGAGGRGGDTSGRGSQGNRGGADNRDAGRLASQQAAARAAAQQRAAAAANAREQARAANQRAAEKAARDRAAANAREQARVSAQRAAEQQAQNRLQQEQQLAAQKAASQASMGPQPLGTITPVDGNYSTRSSFESIIAQNPNIDFGGLTADDVTRDFFGNIYGDIDPNREGDERLGSMGTLSDLGGLGTLGSVGAIAAQMMGLPLDTPTFTPAASLTRQSDLEGNRGGSNQQGIQSLTSPGQTGASEAEMEALLAPSTASQTTTDSIYTPSYVSGETPVLSGLTALPSGSNYMDYLDYAFNTIDTSNPFSGAPSGITGSNPLYRDNPVYAAGGGLIPKRGFVDGPGGYAGDLEDGDIISKYEDLSPEQKAEFDEEVAKGKHDSVLSKIITKILGKRPTPIRDDNSYGHGGMTGFVGEPINIMYAGGMNNDVVDSGISGILKKYKQIRSKL